MTRNYLVTGPPRSGKTTVLERTVTALPGSGLSVGGVVSPERRRDGQRVGFGIRDVATGETVTLASVDRETGPQVGKYRVAVAAVDDLCRRAIPRALDRADAVVIDEIAPMQAHSDGFVAATRDDLPDRLTACIVGAT